MACWWSPAPACSRLTGAPTSFHAHAMAAALAPGVLAVAHGAAARLHGLDGFESDDVIDVIAGPRRRPRAGRGVVVHRTRGGGLAEARR